VLVVAAVGLIVWFGVGFGLRPLLELEEAIARRTPTDLDPIRRTVPKEAKGVVTTLNSLLERISRRISSKDEFISNAAHQLRNPIAGVLALAEAVESAPHAKAAKTRSAELLKAARQTSRLANQLLSFERAAGSDLERSAQLFEFGALVAEAVDHFQLQQHDGPVELIYEQPPEPLPVQGDQVMLREALLNLLNNAVVHGGPQMTRIVVQCRKSGDQAHLFVEDNGAGIPADKREQVLMRFAQANDGPGSGLGLAIATRVMTLHSGSLEILDKYEGTTIMLSIPLRNS
jgi:two-component system sensor histidine kinase TctE